MTTDAIVTVGFLMGEATIEAVTNTRTSTSLALTSSRVRRARLAGVFREDRAGCAAGYLAGLMAPSSRIGTTLVRIRSAGRCSVRAEAGAMREHEAEVRSCTTSPTTPSVIPSGVQPVAQALDQGADVIFAAGGATGNGGLIEIAKDPGAGTTVFCIGGDIDQYFTVPQAAPCLLTSAEKKLVLGTETLVMASVAGEMEGGNFVGPTGLAPYHDTDSVVPDDVKAAVEEVLAGLADGSIDTGCPACGQLTSERNGKVSGFGHPGLSGLNWPEQFCFAYPCRSPGRTGCVRTDPPRPGIHRSNPRA